MDKLPAAPRGASASWLRHKHRIILILGDQPYPALPDLLSVDGHGRGGVEGQADLAVVDGDYHDHHGCANANSLSRFSTQDQHVDSFHGFFCSRARFMRSRASAER